MGKHTPGPWHADDNGDGTHCITAGRGADVADTRSSADERANARLIAAAPQLLAACEAATALAAIAATVDPLTAAAASDALAAALKKARGA